MQEGTADVVNLTNEQVTGKRRDTGADDHRYLSALAVFLPFVWFVYQTLPLRDWLIDDAGISFAYARNLAHGAGLVSQPGMIPVEGYSNPLWVFLLSPLFMFNSFDPVLTPKLLGLLFVLIGFVTLFRSVRRLTPHPLLPGFLLLSLLAMNAPLIIWTSSGLENGLYFALGMLYLDACINLASGSPEIWNVVTAGLLLAGLALTRPEGIAYFPLLLIAVNIADKKRTALTIRREIVLSVLPSLVLVGGYELFRLAYFGDWVSNTSHVKGMPGAQEILGLLSMSDEYLLKCKTLIGSVMGPSLWLPVALSLLITAVVTVVLVAQRKITRTVIVSLIMTGLSLGLYLLMTPDWMREFRFATLFYPSVLLSLIVLMSLFLQQISSQAMRRALSVGMICGALMLTYAEHIPRLKEFSVAPTVPFFRIKTSSVDRYEEIAAYLRLDSASVLLPDLGATLYYSPFRIYDLAGLTDKSIARHRGKDQAAFCNYVFDTIRPTIIRSYGFFASVSHLERDPRLNRDYVPIRDSLEPYWRDSVLAGDYLRRDAVAGEDSMLARLQRGERPWEQVSPHRD